MSEDRGAWQLAAGRVPAIGCRKRTCGCQCSTACKKAPSGSLRRDGYSSGKVVWAPTKTGKERVVPLTPEVLETLRQHQWEMEHLGVYDPYGLVFVTPTSHSNIYDHLVGRVWHRSLERCGLKPRRLYAQRHSFLSHALAMGNSPADLAAAAGHSTKMLLDTYAKPTGRLKMPTWQTA